MNRQLFLFIDYVLDVYRKKELIKLLRKGRKTVEKTK